MSGAPPNSGHPAVDAEFVRRVAALARLEVDEAALPALTAQFGRILDLVSQVAAIDTGGRDPAAQEPVGLEALRADVPGPTLTRRDLVLNAPAHDGAFLVVPKVLGEAE